MPKKEQLKEFYDQAWHIVELMKQGTDHDYVIEEQKLFDILEQFPEKVNNADYMDISDFFVAILLYTHKNSIHEITRDDLVTAINDSVVGSPKKFHFYFRLGRLYDFTEGYQVGSGRLIPFAKLPNFVQKEISWEWKYRHNMDRLYETEKLSEYKKRRKQEWYMHVEVESVGQNKASRKAVVEMRRNINILKVVYDIHGTLFDLYAESPVDYRYHIDKHKSTGGGYKLHGRETIFVRRDYFDQMVMDITSMRINKQPSDLEKRLLNAVDVVGLIDDATPLHIRFLLCVIALEGILLTEGDKDYLGWKLSEKAAFLLGDTPAWIATFYRISPKERTILTEDYINQRRSSARSALDRQIKKFYVKRSGFAHGGLEANKSRKITSDDYNLISSILRWMIERLIELHKKGISHIAAKDRENIGEDTSSLDAYIERLRYS